MDKFGFIRVAACSPEIKPADTDFNADRIIELARECAAKGVELAVFPELCITGYTCADLFEQESLLDGAVSALRKIQMELHDSCITIVVGAPLTRGDALYNCAVVIAHGSIIGVVPKSYLPNYGEFYEKRWFKAAPGATPDSSILLKDAPYQKVEHKPFGTNLLFDCDGAKFGIEICEDLWVPNPPSTSLALSGADMILNLSATNELIGKHRYLRNLISSQSARCRCAYVYASAGLGESSTDLAYAGNCIIAENGAVVAESPRFTIGSKFCIADIDVSNLRHDRRHFATFSEQSAPEEARVLDADSGCCDMESYLHYEKLKNDGSDLEYRKIKAHPFLDEDPESMAERCEEISSIQAWGLMTRLRAIGCRHAVVGISGGLDSTLALLVTVKAFDMLGYDRKGITGITMPGFGTTDRTKSNASRLMELLDVTEREIPIGEAVRLHFESIGHNPEVRDVTYENSQARERTQILMDVANQVNGLVIGTGDMSELALGWCTYNGDQMSMYGVNASIPKTLVRYLVEGYAQEAEGNGNEELAHVLRDIIDTPISPELLPPSADDTIAQKTEDLVGPYELHDFFLYHMLRFGNNARKILHLAEKAFAGKYDRQFIKKWLRTFYRRFFAQQFKRSCMPDGVKAGSICLSPRGDWRMPSDASVNLWLKEFEDDED